MPENEEYIVKIGRTKGLAFFYFLYKYSPMINEFIKNNIPKEHRKYKVVSEIDPTTGEAKDVHYRLIKEARVGQMIEFFVDNAICFEFVKIEQEYINKLRQEYKEKRENLARILKLKVEGIDTSRMDFSLMKQPPREYQKAADKFFEINEKNDNGVVSMSAILGDEPGLGKTYPAMYYAVKNKNRIRKCIVLCPASAKMMWRDAILNFTNEKPFVFKQKNRKDNTERLYKKEEAFFHVINYESLSTYLKITYKHTCTGTLIKPGKGSVQCRHEIINTTKKIVSKTPKKGSKAEILFNPKERQPNDCPNCGGRNTFKSKAFGMEFGTDEDNISLDPANYGMIIVDEAHRMKSRGIALSDVIHGAFKKHTNIPVKLLLSGTPIKNRPKELFALLNFLDEREWQNFHEFGIRYCAAFENGFGYNYDGASNLSELFERIAYIVLRRRKMDVLKDLPEKQYTYIPLELSPEELSKYNKLIDSFKTIENGKVKEKGYLEQIAALKLFISAIKVDRMEDYIWDLIENDEKIVTMSDLNATAEKIVSKFGEDKVVLHSGSISDEKKWEAEKRFREDKKIRIFSGMIIASGSSINLNVTGKLMFFGFAWNSGDMTQASDRIHRQGLQAEKCEILIPYFVNTIEEDLIDLLELKENISSQVLDGKIIKKNVSVPDGNVMAALINRIKTKK